VATSEALLIPDSMNDAAMSSNFNKEPNPPPRAPPEDSIESEA